MVSYRSLNAQSPTQSWAHLWESPSPAASAKCTNKMKSCCLGVPRKCQCLPLLQSLSSECLSQPCLQNLLVPVWLFEPPEVPGGRQLVAAAERNWFSQREKITSFSMAGCLSVSRAGAHSCSDGNRVSFPAQPRFCFFSEPVCGNSPHVPELGEELQTARVFRALTKQILYSSICT